MSKVPEHWRSPAERAQDADYLERTADELNPHAVSPPTKEELPDGLSRRRFLGLMAASAAVSVSACGEMDDRGKIIPYADVPEGATPGTALHYATCLLDHPDTPPALVTVREGRPVKMEGNPDHPASGGALDAFGQAAILSLYNPERLKNPTDGGSAVTWEAIDETVRAALAGASTRGKTVLLVTRPWTHQASEH